MTHDNDALTLGEIDRDGALAESAARVGITRGDALRRAVMGGGALVAGSAMLGALPGSALGAVTRASAGDVDILNFALTLEYLEAAFYAEAVSKGKLSGEAKTFAAVVAKDEAAHVGFLKGALGSKAVAKPMFDFKGTTSDQAKFQATADVLENTGVHAYLGQVGNIKAKPVLVAAGRVLPVEARHAAWIRDIRFKGGTTVATTPAPAGFEDGFTKAKILAAVKATGFIVSP